VSERHLLERAGPVACASDLPVVRAPGVIPLIRPLRPLGFLFAPDLNHAHVNVREVPEARVEVDRQALDVAFMVAER
jgi:hypothetical protein